MKNMSVNTSPLTTYKVVLLILWKARNHRKFTKGVLNSVRQLATDMVVTQRPTYSYARQPEMPMKWWSRFCYAAPDLVSPMSTKQTYRPNDM